LYYLYIWFDNQILTLVFNPNFFCVKWLSLVDMNTSTAANANAKVLSNNSKKSSLLGMLGMGNAAAANAAPANAAAANAAPANNSARATMAGGRRRASRKTRKSRKMSRKMSRKASKKSRKASKKSRKMSRKASKKSRKSRK
jgi:hypothetical protein